MRLIEKQLQTALNRINKSTSEKRFSFLSQKHHVSTSTSSKDSIQVWKSFWITYPFQFWTNPSSLELFSTKRSLFVPVSIWRERTADLLQTSSKPSLLYPGTHHWTMLQIYQSLIQSELDYGSLIYSSARETTLSNTSFLHLGILHITGPEAICRIFLVSTFHQEETVLSHFYYIKIKVTVKPLKSKQRMWNEMWTKRI